MPAKWGKSGSSLRGLQSDRSAFSKTMTAIVAIVVIVAAIAAALVLVGNINSPNPNPSSQDSYWTGMIVPSSEFSSSQSSSGYYFIGNENGTSTESLKVFPVSTSTAISSSIGGSFKIHNESGTLSVARSWTNLSQVLSSDLQSYMNRFQSIEVNITSISVVLDGITYGFGTTGTNDYVWIAPHQQLPTFLNQVRLSGTVIDQATITTVAQKYAQSFIGSIDISKVSEAAAKLDFSFSGSSTKLLLVSSMQYLNTVHVRGDVLDTITPADVQRLSASFLNDGTKWIENVSSSIQEGFAIVSDQHNTLSTTDLWFLLYPTSNYQSFSGLCDFTVAPTDLSLLLEKTPNLQSGAFDYSGSMSAIHINLGVAVDVSQSSFAQKDIKGLWQAVQGAHSYAQVASVEVNAYALVVDAQAIIESLSSAAGISQEDAGKLAKITSFKNPAMAILVDDSVANMIEDNTTGAWEYFAIAIIPNYPHSASGLRYLDVRGVLYDSLSYFGVTGPGTPGLPIFIADDMQDGTSNLQATTIANIGSNGHNGDYVGFDALATGMALKDSSGVIGVIPFIGPVLKAVIDALPFDLCIYNGMQITDAQTNQLFSVPVILLASGKGESLATPTTVHFTGVYFDVAEELTKFNNMIAGGFVTKDLPSMAIDQSVLDLLPVPVKEAISQVSSFLDPYQRLLLNPNAAISGYILAFSMSNVSTSPSLQITEPTSGSSMQKQSFGFAMNTTASPSIVLWVEVGFTVLGVPIAIPLPVFHNGAWSTNDLGWWSDMVSAIAFWLPDSMTLTFRVHDFQTYSDQKSVTINLHYL